MSIHYVDYSLYMSILEYFLLCFTTYISNFFKYVVNIYNTLFPIVNIEIPVLTYVFKKYFYLTYSNLYI